MSEWSDDAAARRIVEPQMENRERVLWAGRPRAGRVLWRSLRKFLGFVAFAAALASIVYLSSAEAIAGEWQRLTAGEMSLAVYAFPVVVAGLVLWRLGSDYRRAGRTAYALTDRRLLSTEGGQRNARHDYTGDFGSSEWSLFPEEVFFVKVREKRGETGNLVFNEHRRSFSNSNHSSKSERKWMGFQQVARPHEVAAQVREWLGERERAAAREAAARRSFTDPAGRFSLDLPAQWSARAAPERMHVLGASGPLSLREAPGAETLVERYGPLGASFALAAAPAGSWRFEEMSDTDHGVWMITEVVDTQPDVRVAGSPGFSVTMKLILHPGVSSRARLGRHEARIKLVFLTHGDWQYQLAQAWLCDFPAMKGVLGQIVRSFWLDPGG